LVGAEHRSGSETPDRRGEIKGSCSGKIPKVESRRSQQLLKLREFVANSILPFPKWKADAVKPIAARRNCVFEPEIPSSGDVGSAIPANSVLSFSV
jgi:hypothetical protein